MASSTTSCIALFVVILCVVVPGALSISFNQTFNDECAYPLGCSFFNASLWDGGVVPSANDDVNITGTWDGSVATEDKVLYLYIDDTTKVTSIKNLYMHAAALVLRENTTLSVNGSAYLNRNGSLYVSQHATFTTSATLTVVSDAWFAVYGTASAVDATLVGGLRVHSLRVENLIFGSYNYSLTGLEVTKSLSVSPSVTLALNELQVGTLSVDLNATVTIQNSATINSIQLAANSVVVANGVATIGTNSTNATLTGTGSLYLHNTASISSALSSANFFGYVFLGDTEVSLYGVALSNLVFNSENTTVYATGVALTGPVTVKGHLGVRNSTLFVNDVLLLGKLLVEDSTLTVLGNLQITENSIFVLERSGLTLNGVVTGDLVIPATSTFSASGANATVLGKFENHGSISLSATSPLNVFGNTNLHNSSKLSATVSTAKAVLFVNGGSLYISGQLLYVISKKPVIKSNTYLIAQIVNGDVNRTENGTVRTVNGTVIGTFNDQAKADTGSQITRALPIQYSSSTVNIYYKWSLKDTQWWIFLIVGVGIAVVLGVIIGLIVRIRVRRANYTPVR